jgi:hypothetical protein
MNRKYWLDLFTGKTWEEFLEAGGTISGFRHRRRKVAQTIKPGDILICYLTGISRFIGVLEVKSDMFQDNTKIWEDSNFPCRFKVEVLDKLTPETAIPIKELEDKLSIFENLSSPNAWTGFFRGSPNQFKREDGELIVKTIREAIKQPQIRDYDERKYWRKPRTFESKNGVVTVPDETDESEEMIERETHSIKHGDKTSHEEIQWLLLKLGSDLGLDVWVARNDKNREFFGHSFSNISRIRNILPRQFDDATNRTIELIDVLWLQGDAIVAAFEVEHTSAIYSGLLRMSDLISMQPNLKINLYIVAPDDRTDKVFNEINRPTFARLKPPLPQICKFIPYSLLKKEIEQMGKRVIYMKPEFIEGIAVSCLADEA